MLNGQIEIMCSFSSFKLSCWWGWGLARSMNYSFPSSRSHRWCSCVPDSSPWSLVWIASLFHSFLGMLLPSVISTWLPQHQFFLTAYRAGRERQGLYYFCHTTGLPLGSHNMGTKREKENEVGGDFWVVCIKIKIEIKQWSQVGVMVMCHSVLLSFKIRGYHLL